MADRFYLNCSLGLGPCLIDGPEAHHLAHVCRLRAGNVVCLFNGDGREYHGTVAAVRKREVEIEITQVAAPERERATSLEVAAPLPKGDRAQFLVEKLTELGVTVFVPLQTTRSVVHPREAKLDRLQRHVVEASKQCGRNVLMRVESLTAWSDYCVRPTLPPSRWLAHPGQTAQNPLKLAGPAEAVVAAVGPEGGFTEEEVALALAHGWQPTHLGPRILRVETAALLLAGLAAAQEVDKRGL